MSVPFACPLKSSGEQVPPNGMHVEAATEAAAGAVPAAQLTAQKPMRATALIAFPLGRTACTPPSKPRITAPLAPHHSDVESDVTLRGF